ncbi:MAG: uroporphyrinogen decarboxylase [Microthrixaceae bacterium]|nr:uroporphyrinogen decarboxylase [Microthrixaceae bacterium]
MSPERTDTTVTRPHADSAFLRAARSEPVAHIPVWFMRQAGRSLPEYRKVRGEGTILDAIADVDRATEITLQPVRRYGVDAAILYSDIMTPAHAIGFGVDIQPGVGPVVERPFTSEADLERLRPLEADVDTPYVLETVRNLTAELDVPLIGFAGAPFTVASYLIEGRPTRTWVHTKALMHTDEPLWHRLMEALTDLAISSLRSQVDAGASAVQLFDSWVGALSPAEYDRFVAPSSSRVLAAMAELDVPRIHFGVHTGELLGRMAAAGAEVVGVDWRTPLDVARERVPTGTALQGNLDPALVAGGPTALEEAVADVIERGSDPRGGHIFNLGHGVLPETDPAVLERVVELVHAHPVREYPPASR